MTINERLKKVRIDQDLSQQKFADKIKLSANFINLIERGARNASDRTLNDVAAEFHVNLEWLKTGEGDMYDEESGDVIIEALKSEYNLDDIDIEKEDLSQIIYEVVNRKAAKPTDKDKRAPKPRTRKKREQSATQQS